MPIFLSQLLEQCSDIISYSNLIASAYTLIPLLSVPALTGTIVLACFGLLLIAVYTYEMTKWSNTCPRCAEKGITTYVLPGKHCKVCGQPC